MQIQVNSKSSRLLLLTQNMFIVINNEIFAALNRQLSPSLYEKKCQNCVTIDINNIIHCGSKNIGKKIFKQILDLVVITIRRIFLLIIQLFQCELKRYISLDFKIQKLQETVPLKSTQLISFGEIRITKSITTQWDSMGHVFCLLQRKIE